VSGVYAATEGGLALNLRLDSFPANLQERLRQRVNALTEELQARVAAAAPFKTGLLRSEIVGNIYTGYNNDRVAGYVSVFASGRTSEYAKAATLEYGTNKTRRTAARTARARLGQLISKRAEIQAYRYLRGPFEQMLPEIEAALGEEVSAAVDEGNA
jgi:hypothetical protein